MVITCGYCDDLVMVITCGNCDDIRTVVVKVLGSAPVACVYRKIIE
jgi:hypothetical protein